MKKLPRKALLGLMKRSVCSASLLRATSQECSVSTKRSIRDFSAVGPEINASFHVLSTDLKKKIEENQCILDLKEDF